MLTGAHIEQFLRDGTETTHQRDGRRWVTREAWVGPFWVRSESYYENEWIEMVGASVFLPDLSLLSDRGNPLLIGGPHDKVLFECRSSSAKEPASEKTVFDQVAYFLMGIDYQPFLLLGERIRDVQRMDPLRRSAYERLEDDL